MTAKHPSKCDDCIFRRLIVTEGHYDRNVYGRRTWMMPQYNYQCKKTLVYIRKVMTRCKDYISRSNLTLDGV